MILIYCGVVASAILVWLVLTMIAAFALGTSVPLWLLALLGVVSLGFCYPLVPLLRPGRRDGDEPA